MNKEIREFEMKLDYLETFHEKLESSINSLKNTIDYIPEFHQIENREVIEDNLDLILDRLENQKKIVELDIQEMEKEYEKKFL